MAVRMRLTRVGSKKNPVYRVVVADSRSPRDGKFIEIVGRYNPQHDPSLIEFDEEKVKDWLGKGAQPSEAVQKLLKVKNISQVVAELLEYLARQLVDEPDAVRVEQVDEDDMLVLRLHVARGRSRQGDRPAGPHRARAAHDRARGQRARAAARAARDRRLAGSPVRVAALYDVHGNLPALDAVLAEVDAGSDPRRRRLAAGPWPAETLERCAALDGDVRSSAVTPTASSSSATCRASRRGTSWSSCASGSPRTSSRSSGTLPLTETG